MEKSIIITPISILKFSNATFCWIFSNKFVQFEEWHVIWRLSNEIKITFAFNFLAPYSYIHCWLLFLLFWNIDLCLVVLSYWICSLFKNKTISKLSLIIFIFFFQLLIYFSLNCIWITGSLHSIEFINCAWDDSLTIRIKVTLMCLIKYLLCHIFSTKASI